MPSIDHHLTPAPAGLVRLATRPRATVLALAATLTLLLATAAPPAQAHTSDADHASVASVGALSLPVAVLTVAPSLLLSAGAELTVVSVEASADGVAWLVRNTADGVSTTLTFSGTVIAGSAVATGTILTVTAVTAGWLLSAAGEVLCFIPNELGASLTYTEQVTR